MTLLQRYAQFAAFGFALTLVPGCVSAQRSAGAPAPVAVAPRAMGVAATVPALHATPVQVGAARPAVHLGASAAGHPAAPHHPLKPALPRPPARSYPVSSRPVYAHGGLTNDSFDDGGYPVPGLGFDYVHYAAVHPRAFEHNFRGAGIVPFLGGGGLYVPFGYYGEPASVVEQPEEAATETEQAAVEGPDHTAAVVAAPAREYSTARFPSAPAPEFIFVRRDGTVFFAVAYSWVNGSLQYITQDGLRKIAPLTTLDLDATSQFNEQRGVSFRSPA
jgi:hypothetical protein